MCLCLTAAALHKEFSPVWADTPPVEDMQNTGTTWTKSKRPPSAHFKLPWVLLGLNLSLFRGCSPPAPDIGIWDSADITMDCIFMPKPHAWLYWTSPFEPSSMDTWKRCPMTLFMSQAKSQSNWGWQGHLSLFCSVLVCHLVQGHVQNRHHKSGCSKPCGILSMSMISQHVSDFAVSLGTQWALWAEQHTQAVSGVQRTVATSSLKLAKWVKEALPRCPSSRQPQVSSSSFEPATLCRVQEGLSASNRRAKAHCPHLCGFQQCPAEPWQAKHPCGWP